MSSDTNDKSTLEAIRVKVRELKYPAGTNDELFDSFLRVLERMGSLEADNRALLIQRDEARAMLGQVVKRRS